MKPYPRLATKPDTIAKTSSPSCTRMSPPGSCYTYWTLRTCSSQRIITTTSELSCYRRFNCPTIKIKTPLTLPHSLTRASPWLWMPSKANCTSSPPMEYGLSRLKPSWPTSSNSLISLASAQLNPTAWTRPFVVVARTSSAWKRWERSTSSPNPHKIKHPNLHRLLLLMTNISSHKTLPSIPRICSSWMFIRACMCTRYQPISRPRSWWKLALKITVVTTKSMSSKPTLYS